jgi:hypothetical protein
MIAANGTEREGKGREGKDGKRREREAGENEGNGNETKELVWRKINLYSLRIILKQENRGREATEANRDRTPGKVHKASG